MSELDTGWAMNDRRWGQRVDLPVLPPVLPMLAKSVKGVPDPAKFPDEAHPGLLYEPKWDLNRPVVCTAPEGGPRTQRPAAFSELSMRVTLM